MGLMKIFSGEQILALGLKGKLEENGIDTVLRNNNQSNVIPSINSSKAAVELFIQETDFAKANPIIDDYRMSI